MPAPEVLTTPRQLREIIRCMPVLQEIFLDLCQIWPNSKQLWVTCVHRGPDEAIPGESGIHRAGPPYRAIDIRIRNLSEVSSIAQGMADAFAEALNERWCYDPKRPRLKVAVSALHGTGPHIHLQVHTRSERRTE